MASAPNFPPGYLEEYTGDQLVAATTVILVIVTTLLILRGYARSLKPGSRGWDDFLLPPTWILLVALCTVMYMFVFKAGVGRHVEAVVAENPNKITTLSKLLYILDWFYVPANMLSRVSVVLLYLRIFTHRLARFFCYVVLTFLICNCIATIIAAQLECTPLAYAWDKTIKGGHCFNLILWYKLTNLPNVTADVAILLLPIPTVWSLKASLARKMGISMVCLTGSVGLIASCVRTAEFFTVDFSDPTWSSSPTLVWTVVESGMYFSAACLVGLRPIYVKVPRWATSLLSNESASQPASNAASGRVGLISKSRRQWPGGRRQYKDLDSLMNTINTTHTEVGTGTPTELEDLKDTHSREAKAVDPKVVEARNEYVLRV